MWPAIGNPVDLPTRAYRERIAHLESPGRPARPAVSERSRPSRRTGVRRFALDYAGMVAAMAVGMVALRPPESLLAAVSGQPHALDGETTGALLMAMNMTVGMAAWMWLRGHRLRLIVETAAGMNLPFLAPVVALWGGLINHHTLMTAGHVPMLLGMLVAMLARREAHIRVPGRRREAGSVGRATVAVTAGMSRSAGRAAGGVADEVRVGDLARRGALGVAGGD